MTVADDSTPKCPHCGGAMGREFYSGKRGRVMECLSCHAESTTKECQPKPKSPPSKPVGF